MKAIFATVIVLVLAVGLLSYTAPGHRVLNALGFATADGGAFG